MVKVRHGIMLTGQSLSGKSQSVTALAQAISALEQPTHLRAINPKAVTLGQLFGTLDANSNAFSEGVLSKLLRQAVEQAGRQWVMFDGAVDALWIENMNTVLDDNKKLCLTSG
jgi:dynein heavy chain